MAEPTVPARKPRPGTGAIGATTRPMRPHGAGAAACPAARLRATLDA